MTLGFDQRLVFIDQLFQILHSQNPCQLDLELFLFVLQQIFKLVFIQIQDYVAVHLDEAADSYPTRSSSLLVSFATTPQQSHQVQAQVCEWCPSLPGMENFAPERIESRSGFCTSPRLTIQLEFRMAVRVCLTLS